MDEIEILEPSSVIQQASNRSGGVFMIKQEVLDVETDEEDVYQDEILKVIQSEANLRQESAAGPSCIGNFTEFLHTHTLIRPSVRGGGTGGNPPVNFEQRVASTRPEIR